VRQHLVYDLPLRFFHWLFAGLFLIGFTIAKTVDDESVLFNYHSLAGLTLGFLVLLRVVWGGLEPNMPVFQALLSIRRIS
jgi:cytochrome b